MRHSASDLILLKIKTSPTIIHQYWQPFNKESANYLISKLLKNSISWEYLPISFQNNFQLEYEIHISSRTTLGPRQDGRHFPDNIFKCAFLNENVWISIKNSRKCVPKGAIDNISLLVQKMAWCRPYIYIYIYIYIYASIGLNELTGFKQHRPPEADAICN